MSILYLSSRAALRQPAGIVFLHPSERVSRSELDRRDRCYRAAREAEYARSWAEDATLVGTVIYTTDGRTASDRSSNRSTRSRRGRTSVARKLGKRLRLKKLKDLFSHA
ncbi:hypothetical protein PSEUBRA_001511 [Kalmanozyma brasiliensis GHG001]|uniref:Uncharacterized protein n=1 Tax=Kalmanozyma brasiliensis (strain GHG001) TaxID=1365824 RepID=V5F0P0_KALBG|nr:uncharacterized protein PSEUBRA_001511 [Kalmanozyma brasiliensis GHG001]EST08809.1 hypothetical protein PSEUBRA_001511 [Kalmanozyma brasiliensis GHG001]